jgi:hypothetical protein
MPVAGWRFLLAPGHRVDSLETAREPREAIMSAGPTASNTLGLIGVELYRLHVSSVSATNFVFAAVQTDLKWAAWYTFFDGASSSEEFSSRWSTEDYRAADHYGTAGGPTKHEFHRAYLHTTRSIRVDGLTGDDKTTVPAVMFMRNSLRKGHVLVDIDVSRTDGFLQLRRLHLEGHIPKEFDAQSIRGALSRDTRAHPFHKKDLMNPPSGSELQLE